MDIPSFLGFLGLCVPIYLVARLAHYAHLELGTSGLLSGFLLWSSVVLYILSFPLGIIMHIANAPHINRLLKKHDSDMATASLKYTGKCFHCYSRHISRHRPFGYDSERGVWTDRDEPFDIYIPKSETLPTLLSEDRIQEDIRLYKDIYAAHKVLRPFNEDAHIGQINPYTKRPIMSEEDYNEYLRFLSHETATRLRDPFAS